MHGKVLKDKKMVTSLRVNGLVLLIGLCLGYYFGNTFQPERVIAPLVKTDVKTKTVKVTSPNGRVTETTETVSKSDEKPVKIEDNLTFFVDHKLRQPGVMLRVEHFNVGLGYSMDHKEPLIFIGYSTRIF